MSVRHGFMIEISPTTTHSIVSNPTDTMNGYTRLLAALAGLFSAVAAQDVTEQKVNHDRLSACLLT